MKFISNRTIILFTPKQPMVDWINNQDAFNLDEEVIKSSKTIYMISELDIETNESLREYLKINYKPLFYNELQAWYPNDKLYPKITFQLFESWIEYNCINMCFDTASTKIKVE